MIFKAQLAKDAGTIEAAVAQCKSPILEPKYDGWRGIVIVQDGKAEVYNRSQKCYTGQLPELEAELAKLPEGTILDGELVCMAQREDGSWDNDFHHIHTVMRSNTTLPSQRARIQYVVFDCLAHGPEDYDDITSWVQSLRRDMAETLLSTYQPKGVSLTIQAPATQTHHDALVALGFEGTVVKDQARAYAFGKRGHGWFKIKATRTVDMVVMALPVNGKNQYEGQVGHMVLGQYASPEIAALHLGHPSSACVVKRCTVNPPDQATRRDMTEAPDKYIGRCVEIKVYGWNEDGGPRHPTFVRWREDKDPAECDWRNE